MPVKLVTLDVHLSENTKRTLRWVVLPLAVLVGSMAVAHAYDTKWIASGQPVSAASLKTDLDSIQTQLASLSSAVAAAQDAGTASTGRSAVAVEISGPQSGVGTCQRG